MITRSRIHNQSMIGKKIEKLTILKLVSEFPSSDENPVKYLCRCDCGNEVIVKWNHLRTGNTKSCGCNKILNKFKLPEGEGAFNILFRTYKKEARERKLTFELDVEEFKKLTQQNCFYCGKEPCNIINKPKMNGYYTYNGVDRVDNELGYILTNCVACCITCNRMKINHSLDNFKNQIIKIYNNLNLKDFKDGNGK